MGEAAPNFGLLAADGSTLRLDHLRGQVIVLNFIYTTCPDVCPLHSERIAEVQAMASSSSLYGSKPVSKEMSLPWNSSFRRRSKSTRRVAMLTRLGGRGYSVEEEPAEYRTESSMPIPTPTPDRGI